MKKLITVAIVCVGLVVSLRTSHASGPVGFYGIVDKVVFEPNEQSPERIQVWGTFAYVDGDASRALGISAAKRGYLYFKRAPSDAINGGMVGKEWTDLKAVAGTGQAIGFGSWGYIGSFDSLRPDARSNILERGPSGSIPTDLRVRPASETPQAPANYQTNAGIVKLTAQGSHAAIVKALKNAQ